METKSASWLRRRLASQRTEKVAAHQHAKVNHHWRPWPMLRLPILVGAIGCAVLGWANSGSSSARIWVLKEDLPAGAVIGADQLQQIRWPATARPSNEVLTAEQSANRRTKTAIPANWPIRAEVLEADTAGGQQFQAARTHWPVLPVPLAPAQISLLAVGDQIELWTAGTCEAAPCEAVQIAAPAWVVDVRDGQGKSLRTPRAASDEVDGSAGQTSAEWGWSPPSANGEPVVLVAVPREQTSRLLGVSDWHALTLVRLPAPNLAAP